MGIDIELHLFFILFILAFALVSQTLALLLVIIFFFVTLHELTHSVVAIRNKIRVRKIVLLPIGGMAVVESTDISPITEIKMSLAGPMLNIALVYVCLLIAYLFSLPIGTWLVEFFDPAAALALPLPELIFFYSFYANLILGIFNLFVPAFPLDGGRILRALLALRLDYIRASAIAKNISLAIAGFLFCISFLYGEIWLMIISFFIAFGAMSEFESMVMHKALSRIKIRDVLSKDFLAAGPQESINSVLQKMMERRKGGAIIRTKAGLMVIGLAEISRTPKKDWDKKAASIAKRAFRATIDMPVEGIARKMDMAQTPIVPVFDGRKLIGVIERTELERAIRIIEAIRKAK